MDVVHRFQMNRPYLAFVPSQTERSLRPHPARAALLLPPLRKNSAGSGFPGRREPESDFPGLSRHWTVVAIATGEGTGGRPLPGKMVPESSSPANPHPARPSASSPPSGGAVHGDIQWKAVPGNGAGGGFPEGRAEKDLLLPVRSRGPPCSSGPWGYRHGEWGPGEGLPPAGGSPHVPPQPPPPEGGSTWRYRGKAVSRDATPPDSVKKDRYLLR